MKYVFDTSPFVSLFKNFYPSTFVTLWQNFDALIGAGEIVSTREVYSEIQSYSRCHDRRNVAEDPHPPNPAPALAISALTNHLMVAPPSYLPNGAVSPRVDLSGERQFAAAEPSSHLVDAQYVIAIIGIVQSPNHDVHRFPRSAVCD